MLSGLTAVALTPLFTTVSGHFDAAAGTVITVSAASYENNVAPDSIASAFGAQMATTTFTARDADPNTPGIQLPTMLAGASVEINGRRAGLFFVSPNQINFLIPADAAPGTANVRVTTGAGMELLGTVRVSNVAPAILTANADGRGVPVASALRVLSHGVQSYENVARYSPTGGFTPQPIDLGGETEQVFLILYVTGIRRAPDANGDGNLNESVKLLLGGTEIIPAYAGRQPDLNGLDQINLRIPRNLIGSGKVGLFIISPGAATSNRAEIEVGGVSGVTPPQVSSFNQTAALAGQVLTIFGRGFALNPENNLVRIGGVEAAVTGALATQLNVLVPYGAESGAVRVRTSFGEGVSSNTLAVRTSISGVVETTARQPLSNVTVRVRGSNSNSTGANGVFLLPDAPPGLAVVEVSAQQVGATPPFDNLRLLTSVSPNKDNQFARPIALQQATGVSAQVGGANLSEAAARLGQGTALRIAAYAPAESDENNTAGPPVNIQTGSVQLDIPAQATFRFPDGATAGRLTLTQVGNSRTPVPLPNGVFSSTIVQITPLGVTIAPGGKLTFPNADFYAPGAQVTLFKLDQTLNSPTLGAFIEAGPATVSSDGQRIETAPGAIAETSYYFVAQVRPTTTVVGRVLDSNFRPARNVLVRARGQESFSDGNGGFVLRNVALSFLAGQETLTIEASLVRPTGRTERTQRSGVIAVRDGLTKVAPELILPATNTNQPPVLIAPTQLNVEAGKASDFNLVAHDPDTGQPVGLTVAGAGFATIVQTGAGFALRLAPSFNHGGNHTVTITAADRQGGSTSHDIAVAVIVPNRAPTANAQSLRLNEDASLSFTLTGSDPDNDALSFAVVSLPAHGALTGTAPQLVYTPAQDYNGADSFTFRANDGQLDGAPATISFTINQVNDAPVLTLPGAQTIRENEQLSFTVAVRDADSGQRHTFFTNNLPPGATFSPGDRRFTWTPGYTQAGTYTVSFAVIDDGAPPLSDAQPLTITVQDANRAPTANLLDVSTDEDTAKQITLSGSDPDGHPITYIVTSPPVRGALSGTAPNLTYTPTANFHGADSFTFKVNDGNLDSTSATVRITINPVNDAPVANALALTTDEDTAKTFTLTGSDIDNDALSFVIVTPPTKGAISGAAPNLTYTPNKDYHGADSFAFKANDGKADSSAVTVPVTINPVNDAPVLSVPGAQTANEGQSLSFTVSATDVDNETLIFTAASLPAGASFNTANRQFTWTPDYTQSGNYTVSFTVSDGAKADGKTVAITVNNVNRAPIAAQTPAVALDEDTTKQITLAGSDPDGDAITFQIVSNPAHGGLSGTAPNLTYAPTRNYNGADSFTFKVNDGQLDSNVVTVALTINPVNDAPVLTVPGAQTVSEGQALNFTATATDIDAGQTITLAAANLPQGATFNAANGQFTWTPSFAQSGDYTVNFTATDNGVPPLSDARAVLISVGNVNRVPVANAQSVTTAEDTAAAITLTASDADGDPLTFAVVSPPAHGSLSGTAPNLTYTPAANYNGADSFTFKANDGKLDGNVAMVTISVTPVNDPPTISAPSQQAANEGQALNFTVTASDPDAGQTLTLAAANLPTGATFNAANGQFSWTPDTTQSGSYSVTFTVTDNGSPALSASKTVAITVNDTNRPPVANAQASVTTSEDTPKAITLTASDPDGDALTYSIVANPAHGTLAGAAPNLTYTPAANYNGTDSFTFKVNDGKADSNVAAVTIAVSAVNDTPSANSQTITTAEDAARSFTLTGSDADGDVLTYAVVTQPAHGSLSGAAPNLTYTPAANYNGADSFTFKVSDGAAESAAAAISITVTPVNDAPVLTVPGAQSVAVGQALSFTVAATDIDAGQTITLSAINLPTGATFNPANGQFSWTPTAGQEGDRSVTFTATDNGAPALSDTKAVLISVGNTNRPPVCTAQTITTDEDTPRPVTLACSDPDGDSLTVSLVALPMHGGVSGTAPALTYSPDLNYHGADSFTFKANDGKADSNTAAVSVTINAVCDAPALLVPVVQTATLGQALSFNITATDPDSGDVLTLATTSLPPGASFTQTNGTTGQFTWTPNIYAETTAYIVTFRAMDNCSTQQSDTKSVTINVGAGAQEWAPTAGPEGGKIAAAVFSNGNAFVAVEGGGVYRSGDNGGSWTPVNTGLLTAHVTALAEKNNVLFAGTDGQGVFRSADNGATWAAFNTGLDFLYVHRLAASDTQLYVNAGDENFDYEVLRSPLATADWTEFGLGLGTGKFLNDFAAAGGKVFAANVDGVYVTAAAAAARVQSVDWTPFNAGLPDVDQDSIPDVTVNALAAAGGRLFAGTTSGAYVSATDRAAWAAYNTNLPAGAAVEFLEASSTRLFAALSLFDNNKLTYSVAVSPLDTANWATANAGLTNRAVRAFVFSGATALAGTAGNGVYRTTDNGASWVTANGGLRGATVTALLAKDGLLLAGTDGGGVFSASNNGAVWTTANSGLEPFLPLNVTSLISNGAELYLGSCGSGVFRSTDNGATWTALNNAQTADACVKDLLVSGNKLFAAIEGSGLFTATVGNSDWARVTSVELTNLPTMLFKTATQLFLGTERGTILRSDLNGVTWTAAGTGLTGGFPVSAFALRGNALLVGRLGDGVYRSTDNGDNFARVVTGLSNQDVSALRVNGSNVYAATRGGGVFLSSDDGGNWAARNASLPNLRVFSLGIKDTKIYAGAEGGGVFLRPLKD